jgi:hypothetical protein
MRLGDLVYYITYYTGIRWVVKKIWGEDCGCDQRREDWNDIDLLCRLHSKYYNHKYYEPCSCSPKRLLQWIADIDKIYD